ncbi:Os06g0222100 [Oryza sativa Japonica Group]|uniref:Trehalose 6-phosphate phosphatase n=1 Tax=Oryza sativa subsp. japonica TaxID=39947 RepID=A0A0P0WU42_ORYSJ|nr:hypothetical protein EE612_032768 [Oryza sativa]BAS96836.1 Os06g0222100 [Oryza sativa Japonica Group]
MTNQDVVMPDIAAAAAMPGSSGRAPLFACRGAAAVSASSMLGGGGAAYQAAVVAHVAPVPAIRPCASWVVEAMRASSPTRPAAAAVDAEYDAWTVSRRSRSSGCVCLASVVIELEPRRRLYAAEEAPVGAGQLRAGGRGGEREARRRVPRLRRHPLPHRRRPRHGLHVRRDEGGRARRGGALPGGDRDRALRRQGAELRRPPGALLRRQPWHGHQGPQLQRTSAAVALLSLHPHNNLPKSPSPPHSQSLLLLLASHSITKSTPGARVENNKFCLSVHFRCVDEKRWNPLAEQVKAVLRDYPELKLTQGRKVLEIRPSIMWDKGKAVEFLLKSLGFDDDRRDVLPVYIGDDRTDEDAFKVLRKRGQGLGILVSKCAKETDASYSLQDPAEVHMVFDI